MQGEHLARFYIGGRWVVPVGSGRWPVMNPATEETVAEVSLGTEADVDAAVAAARKAFESFALTSREERLELMDRVIIEYRKRSEDLAQAVTTEMGAPVRLARSAHVPAGITHFETTMDALAQLPTDERLGPSRIWYEPVGVCGLITPWNWPLNQIAAKVAPALAAGCTMVLKPSEIAPLSAVIVAEILDAAGVPHGVFNLVHGDGASVGAALSSHPGIDMISFTGSTRAGIEVARAAAPTVKRVTQELGGKSPNVILDDANLREVLGRDIPQVMANSGQTCNACARILVPEGWVDEASDIAREVVERLRVGSPEAPGVDIGPLASAAQFEKVQDLIRSGIEDGAQLVCGGPGRPDGLTRGYFTRPTVFGRVALDLRIAVEEVFGPVITISGYTDVEDAIRLANNTPYGLSARVSSSDPERAYAVARRLRTGMVHVNGTPTTPGTPFGGYKRSGNGREYGAHGLREFLEVKAVHG